jgi:hypothetical protein
MTRCYASRDVTEQRGILVHLGAGTQFVLKSVCRKDQSYVSKSVDLYTVPGCPYGLEVLPPWPHPDRFTISGPDRRDIGVRIFLQRRA